MVVALSVLEDAHWLSGDVVHGLKIVAVAIVAQAVWGMAQTCAAARCGWPS
jgi:chromate transporter